MKVWPNEIPGVLQQSGIPIVTCLHGEEPLLSIESADAILAHARDNAYEVKRVYLDNKTNWNNLATDLGAMSLFESKKLIFLQLPFEAKLPESFTKQITKLLPLCTEGSHLLIQLGKLSKSQMRAKWFSGLSSSKESLTSECKTPTDKSLLGWIRNRLNDTNIKFDYEVVEYLAYRCNGNLLAAKQEIDLLALSIHHSDEQVASLTIEITKKICSDHARFNFYDLKDACLRGQYYQAMHIIDHLEPQTKDSELFGLVATFQYELNRLLMLQQHMDNQQTLAMALNAEKVPRFLESLYRAVFSHLSKDKLRYLVELIDTLERTVKGDTLHQPWMLLRLFAGVFAGQQDGAILMEFCRTQSPEQSYHAI